LIYRDGKAPAWQLLKTGLPYLRQTPKSNFVYRYLGWLMKKTLLLIALAVILFEGCKKQHPAPNTPSLSDFPLKTGDTWTYSIDDSINHTTQTAIFTITGSYTINGPVYYTTQTVINGIVVDSGSIIATSDSVIYQPNGEGLFSSLTLLFPMAPNSYWHTRYTGDSVFVSAANISFNLMGITYDSVYNVGRVESVPDLYIHQNLYIAPHVGIIQETLDVQPWIPVHKTLKLISYQLQ
jgi:hypothetical protein